MRTGEVIETAECDNCHRLIRHTYWGEGGTQWTHMDDGRVVCAPPLVATPREGSVLPVRKDQP